MSYAALDANVKASLQRQEQLNQLDADQAKEYVQRTEFISRDAEFAEKGIIKVATAAKRRQAQIADAEMLHLDEHLVRIRRERLRQFYLDEYKQLQAELEEKGFSLPY